MTDSPADESPSGLDELVFMVAGDDERGDHHIFVSVDKARAEARYRDMMDRFTNVKANWLES